MQRAHSPVLRLPLGNELVEFVLVYSNVSRPTAVVLTSICIFRKPLRVVGIVLHSITIVVRRSPTTRAYLGDIVRRSWSPTTRAYLGGAGLRTGGPEQGGWSLGQGGALSAWLLSLTYSPVYARRRDTEE